jgi:hypothetical protein
VGCHCCADRSEYFHYQQHYYFNCAIVSSLSRFWKAFGVDTNGHPGDGHDGIGRKGEKRGKKQNSLTVE